MGLWLSAFLFFGVVPGVLVRLRYVALESGGSFGMVRCAPDTLYRDKECPESPFCSLVLAGSVVGAPGADNLKIRPEFFLWECHQCTFSTRHSRDRRESIQRVQFLRLRILVKRRYVALEFGGLLGIN